MTVALSGDLHRGPDTHTNRPAATAVGVGTLYECTTHSLVYRSDGSSWSTWAAVLPPGGSSGDVLTKASTTDYDADWEPSTGGGGGTPWTAVLNNDLSSLTGFTGLSGTWAISSGVTRQSDTTASTVRRLKYNTKVAWPPLGVASVEMKYNARSTGSARMGLLHKFDGTSGGTGYLTYLETTDGTTWACKTELDALANLTNFGSVTYTSGNWAELQVLWDLQYWVVLLDTVLLDGGVWTPTNGTPLNGFVGLYTYGCDASFQNFKVSTPTMPA